MQTESTETYRLRKLPGLGYLFKLLLRHGFWAFLITLPVVALVILGLSRIEITYQSKATLIFDPRDSSISATSASYPEFSQIGNIYLNTLADKSFLNAIGRKLGYFERDPAYYRKPVYIAWLAGVIPESLTPTSWSYDEEDYKAHVIQAQIKRRLRGTVVPNSYELELQGRGSSPEDAQHIVTEAFDTFVEFQFREALRRNQSTLDTYDSYLQQERLRVEEMSDIYSIYDNTDPGSGQALNLSRQQKQQLKNRERSLIAQVLNRQGEIEQTLDNQIRRKLELEAELQSLLTRRGPTHPEVVQTRRQLEDLERTRQQSSNLHQDVEVLMKELMQVQSRLRRAGVPIDMTLQIRNMTEEGQLFLSRLNQQVKELKLEQQNLETQLNNPPARTRYRLSNSPSIDTSPANKKQILAASAVGFLMILMTGSSVIVFREFFNPVATDDWRIINRYPLPFINQFEKAEMNSLEDLSPDRIRQIKSRIDSPKLSGKDASIARALQHARKVEQTFLNHGIKGSHALVFVGQHSQLGALARTIANCCAIDQDEGVILIDCNHTQPAIRKADAEDLQSFLKGDCKWRDAKVPASSQHAFDYSYHSIKDQNADPLKTETMKKLLGALREKYQLIVINGFPGGLFVENSRILQHTDSIVLGIVLGSARYDEIDAAIRALDSNKLKGIFLIQS